MCNNSSETKCGNFLFQSLVFNYYAVFCANTTMYNFQTYLLLCKNNIAQEKHSKMNFHERFSSRGDAMCAIRGRRELFSDFFHFFPTNAARDDRVS